MSSYKYIELFAGCGGLSYGLESAGLTAHTLIELDKNCVKTLKKNFNAEILEQDVRTMDYEIFKGVKIDLVVGGVPCQSFSIAGKREGLDNKDKGGLFNDFFRCLKEINPNMFLVENVEGLKTINNGETLKFIITKFRQLGYTVDYRVLNAVDYEVPQKRKRLIIIGTKYGTIFNWPKPINNILTVRDALLNVPDSKGFEYNDKKKTVLDLVPQGGCWVDLPEPHKTEYMGNSLNSGGGKRGIARRLAWNEPCLTLTTSPQQKQTERCHPDETRPLRTREYARIQTFPDTHEFEGAVGTIYKQIGNAVPCKLGYHIGKQIIECMDRVNKRMIVAELFNRIFTNIEIYRSSESFEIIKPTKSNKSIKHKQNNLMTEIRDTILKFYESKIKPIYASEVTIKNVDKIKKKIDMISYNITEDEWEIIEKRRIRDKQINNKIGELHEHILGNLKKWEKCKNGNDDISDLPVDICNNDRSIFIELKNNFNTMNASSKKGVISNLLEVKKKYPDAKVVIGIVNGKDYQKIIKQNKTDENNTNNEIWEYSGKRLYELVYGSDSYYDDVMTILDEINKKVNVSESDEDKIIKSTKTIKKTIGKKIAKAKKAV